MPAAADVQLCQADMRFLWPMLIWKSDLRRRTVFSVIHNVLSFKWHSASIATLGPH